jgi:hypothetical protein
MKLMVPNKMTVKKKTGRVLMANPIILMVNQLIDLKISRHNIGRQVSHHMLWNNEKKNFILQNFNNFQT